MQREKDISLPVLHTVKKALKVQHFTYIHIQQVHLLTLHFFFEMSLWLYLPCLQGICMHVLTVQFSCVSHILQYAVSCICDRKACAEVSSVILKPGMINIVAIVVVSQEMAGFMGSRLKYLRKHEMDWSKNDGPQKMNSFSCGDFDSTTIRLCFKSLAQLDGFLGTLMQISTVSSRRSVCQHYRCQHVSTWLKYNLRGSFRYAEGVCTKLQFSLTACHGSTVSFVCFVAALSKFESSEIK